MLMRSWQNLEHEKRQVETQIRQHKDATGVVGVSTDEVESLRLQKLQANLKAVDLELLFADIFLQNNRLYERIADLTHQISQKDWQYMDGRFTFGQAHRLTSAGIGDAQKQNSAKHLYACWPMGHAFCWPDAYCV
jgi:hypothetical protein